jgi:hypothetical protein
MAADQRNMDYFSYDSADGTTYNIRCASEWAAIAAHGLAARGSGQPRYISTGRRRPRKVTYVDLTTGRSKSGPVGTAAAFAALNEGDIQAFHVEGETATVDYTLASKTEEKVPNSVARTHLPDHA